MKMPIPIRSYLASAKKSFRRRNRAPFEKSRFNGADFIGFDVDNISRQSSNEKRADEYLSQRGIGFALPGAMNHSFEHNPFADGIGTNNNAAAWMGLGVAVGAFVLVFGGYVAIAGMGNPDRALRDAQALQSHGTVIGMRWLPGDSASLPELPLVAAAAPVAAASASALLAELDATPKPAARNTAPAAAAARTPIKTSAASAARRDARLRAGDNCADKNQRGCYRRYAAKAPAADSINSALAAHHLLNDFDQRASPVDSGQTPHSPSTYLHHAGTYQHH
jgi:hypothetical protein